MLGLLRFLLAYLVVVSHLVGGDYYAHFGFYAVRGFFILSGYLMTAALNDVYRFDGVRFWTNRALRLLPPYFLVCALTLTVIVLLPAEAGQYLKFWHAPAHLRDLLLNLSVMSLQFPDPSFRFVPPYWSVAVEIDMYLLLYLVVARRMAFAVIALAASLAYQLSCQQLDLPWAAYYFTAPSAVLPFAVGALLYFIRKGEFFSVPASAAAVAFPLWLGNMLAGGWLFPDSYIFGIGYYLDTILFAVVVAGLIGRKFHPLVKLADKSCGEWAYFVFLIQWLAGFAIASALHLGDARGWALFLGTAPLAALGSAALAVLNRKFVEPLRDVVRERPAGPAPILRLAAEP
jgi:peptidoglycan/LPS O-acetylase OafA/YrhL